MKTPVDAIRSAIAIVGAAALADGLRVTRTAPLMWISRGKVPVEHRPGIERLTGGRVPVESLGKEMRWVRVADPAWPRQKGRPLADYTANKQRVAAK